MGVFRSPLQDLYKRADRGGFAGGVSELGAPPREVPRSSSGRVVVQEIHSGNSDPSKSPSIVARLLHLAPISPALQKRRDKLVAELFPLMEAAEELEKTILEYRQRTLEAQLVELRAKCRKQAGVVKLLTQRLNEAELALMNAAAAAENEVQILKNMRAVQDEGRHVPAWPTPEELDEWGAKFAAQQGKIRKANEHAAAALAAREEARLKIEPAEREMDRLVFEERRLKNEVSGQPSVDLELGLDTLPSGYTRERK
jgi:hypothetical protein